MVRAGRIVLSHLTDNAMRHNARKSARRPLAETIRFTVSNDGDPISESNREKMFDAFFTTRRDTGSTGISAISTYVEFFGEPWRKL